MSPLLITYMHAVETVMCCLCVCVCVKRESKKGWAQKTWTKSCGLWDYLSLSISVCLSASLVHSSTQSFSHQQGNAPHALLVIFFSFFFFPPLSNLIHVFALSHQTT